MRSKSILALATLSLAATAAVAAGSTAPNYVVAGSIAGPDGSWDYASIDPAAHRLYVARAASVTMVDLGAAAAVTSWGEIARGHAVVPLPGDRLLVTSGNDATVRILDTRDGHQLVSIAVGKRPDAALYDSARHRALIMNAGAGTVSVLDTRTLKVTATIAVKEGLESAVVARDGTLFVNDEDANEIEVIDVTGGKVAATIALAGCEGPAGLGYDARRDHLISACANGKAAIVDAHSRKLLSLLDIGKGPDAVIVDDARRVAFIPCGRDGVLDILSLDEPGGVTMSGRITTELGARTGALDPATGAVYLPTARFGPPATPGGRPAMLPGSFHVLVVKPA